MRICLAGWTGSGRHDSSSDIGWVEAATLSGSSDPTSEGRFTVGSRGRFIVLICAVRQLPASLTSLPTVTRLDLATLVRPEWHPEAGVSRDCAVFGYVIDHPDGAILVDTGVGQGNAFIDDAYRPQCTDLHDALATAGVTLRSVVTVVNSHLHFDHCGQNPLLYGTDVAFFVGRLEIEQVDRDPYYTDSTWALPPLHQRRLVDGDLEIAEGVTILSTPGHTAGHQSVLIDSDEGRIVIGAQVVWNTQEFIDEIATESNVDSEDLRI